MDKSDVQKPHFPELDSQLWLALWEIRNYLIWDDCFTYLIFGPGGHGSALRQAFDLIDCLTKLAIEEGWIHPIKVES